MTILQTHVPRKPLNQDILRPGSGEGGDPSKGAIMQHPPIPSRRQRARLQLHQLRLREPARPEDSDLRQRSTHHRDLVTRVQTWARLAVLVDLVRQSSTVNDSEAEVKEEVGNSGEQAYRSDALLLRLSQQGPQQLASRALSLGLGLHHNRPHLGQVRSIQMERAASQEHAALRLRNGEIPHVLAALSVVPAPQRPIAPE